MKLEELTPRLSYLLKNCPKHQIPGIAMGIMRLFGYAEVPKDFFQFDLYVDNPTIAISSKYIDREHNISFEEKR